MEIREPPRRQRILHETVRRGSPREVQGPGRSTERAMPNDEDNARPDHPPVLREARAVLPPSPRSELDRKIILRRNQPGEIQWTNKQSAAG